MRICRAVLFGLCFAGLVSLQAAPVVFFGEDLNGNPLARVGFPNAAAQRSMFLAQLPGSSTNTLESLSAGTLVPMALSFSGITSTVLSGGNSIINSLSFGTDGFGEFPTSGNNYVSADANSGLTFTFSSPVTSFGFYGTDFGDFGGNHLSVTFTGASGSITQNVNNTLSSGRGTPADGSVLFFGYINLTSPFTSVQISSLGDSFGIDDPVIGVAPSTTAPEPGSVFLLTAGCLILALKRLLFRVQFPESGLETL